MTNEIKHSELDQMREQMTKLKEELGKQKIINEKILRKAMVGNSSWLGELVKTEILLTPVMLLLMALPSLIYGASWWPLIVLAVMLFPSIWIDTKTITIPAEKIQNSTFFELQRFILHQSKMRSLQFIVEIILVVPCLIWYIYETGSAMATENNPMDMTAFIVISVIASVCSIAAALFIYEKINKTSHRLLVDLNNPENY